MRSTYEIRIAKVLTEKEIRWLYEVPIALSNGRTYRADFYLYDLDIRLEPKGEMKPTAKEKLTECYQLYAGINLRILYEKDVKELEESGDVELSGMSLGEQVAVWRFEEWAGEQETSE